MDKLNEKKIDSTLSEPTSSQAIEFQDNFDDEMVKSGIQLTEVDKMLNEKQQSLKKKIWNLQKMEALVHADPKLSAVYDNMAEDGEEKYGYHYNETIMNIIFNDYVLNDPKYLAKYRQAIPKEKKRRDKSGINKLRKDAEEMEQKRADYRKEKAKGKTIKSLNERVESLYENSSSIISSLASFESPVGFKDDVKNISKEIDTESEKKALSKVEVSLPGKEKRAYGEKSPLDKDVSSAVAVPEENKELKKPHYPGGKMVGADHMGIKLDKLKGVSKNTANPQNNINENTEKMVDDNKKEVNKPEEQIEETTSAGGAAGAGTSYVGYAGPSAWGDGDLTKGKKTKKDKDSFWTGGKVIQESNYLTETEGFEKMNKMLNENVQNVEDIKQMLNGTEFQSLNHEGMVYVDNGVAYSGNNQQPIQLNDEGWEELYNEYFESEFGYRPETLTGGNLSTDQLADMGLIETTLEEAPHQDMISTKDQLKQFIQRSKEKTGKGLNKFHIPMLAGEALYTVAVQMADRMLPLPWDQMSDTNSMWDYIDENGGMKFEEFKAAVKEAAQDRMSGEDMGMEGMFEGELDEKAKSKSQQRFMGMVRAYQKGELKDSEVSQSIKDAAKSMTDDEVEDFASTKHDKLPEKINELDNQTFFNAIEKMRGNNQGNRKMQLVDNYFREFLGKELMGATIAAFDADFIDDGRYFGIDIYLSDNGKISYNSTVGGDDQYILPKDEETGETQKITRKDAKVLSLIAKKVNPQTKYASGTADLPIGDYMNENNVDPVTYYIISLDGENYMANDRDNFDLINKYRDNIVDSSNDEEELYKQYINYPINENPALMALGTAAATGAGQEIGGRIADKVGLNENDIDPTYTHFAVYKPNGKIIEGWEYEGYDPDELKADKRHYFINDVIDLDFKPRDVKIITRRGLQRQGIDPFDIKNWYTERYHNESILDDAQDSMKMKPPIGTQGGDFPTGMQSVGGVRENVINKNMEESKKYLEDASKELNMHEMHHNKLMEDRKPSTLVMKDRLGDDNAKNFKKDLVHSGTKEIIDTTKELEWEDQQTDIGKDPQKLSKDLEKQALKNTNKGTSLKNVGDSANYKGDEIPKRNLSDDEQNEVDLYRKGLGDVNFDNDPGEKFMERMKQDMGEVEFKKREDRMEFEADKPMYNKDTQPIEDGLEKDQFDKNKSKWNDRMGINESVVITGKYRNELNKTSFVDFKAGDVKIVESINENSIKLNLSGLGNTYSNKVELHEGVSNAINKWGFYLQENKVVVYKEVKNLAESDHREMKMPVNAQFNKMKHLLGYKPQEYINTKNNKIK